MPANYDELIVEVARYEGIVPSAVAALNGVADQIAAAVAADNLEDNTQTAQLAGRLRTQADDLAAAIAQNPGTPV